jgi:hypothetical protein
MKRTVSIIAVMTMVFATFASASEWSDKYLGKIRAMEDPLSGEDFALLATLASNESAKEEVQLVRGEAWELLRNHEDFPGILVERLEEFRRDWKATGISNRYCFERLNLIRAMGEMPDVRVVEKLGELLYDMEWTEDPIEHARRGADYGLVSPNGKLAARALAKLVENPPLNKDPENYLDSDVEPWRLWYEQLKAGNRTFRFKGDPQEYSLSGPATAMSKETAESPVHTTRASKPQPPVEAGPEAEVVKRQQPVIPLVAACVVLLATLWLWMRARNRLDAK